MFLTNDEFDKGLIYFLRNSTKNFILRDPNLSINGLPMNVASVAEEGLDLNTYIDEILMKMNEDAQGFLLYVVPIVLRINVFIVNIDTSDKARKKTA
jgi:hypothetical protein